ncbi:MAG: OmpA family protein [Myxococcota bacterium]
MTKCNRGWLVSLACVAALGWLGSESRVSAQNARIDLNQFRPAELATDGFAVSTADGQGHKRFGVSLWVDYSDDAFRIASGPDDDIELVHQQVTGHLMWNLGLWDHLVLFMDIPYHFVIRADDGAGSELPASLQSLAPNGGSLGDIYFGARGNLYGTRDDIVQVALQATLTINTASLSKSGQAYAGQADEGPYIGGWFEAMLNFNVGKFIRIPLQAGYRLATADVQVTPELEVGDEWTFGGGVMAMLGQDHFMISAEAFGRTAANPSTRTEQQTPVEVLGGFKWLPDFGLAVGVGGSAGVTNGYGAPDWRVFAMVGYTMPGKEKIQDADGDGVPDDTDECPNDAEDLDGFQDEDGCPDLDNDGDGIPDVDDRCPDEAEDIDGFEDGDGCPDLDNDGDGIPDVDDQCPDDAGPIENNGCPDPDADGDGVPDRIDNCPKEPGTADNQGCQDKQLVVIGDGQLEILEKVYFRKGSAKLQKRSWALLDNVAAVLNAHPEITKVRVEGHSDKSGNFQYNMRLSKKRADTVVRYLVGRGKVRRSRLVAKGLGPKEPLVPDAKTKEEMALNRRVEFHIVGETNR